MTSPISFLQRIKPFHAIFAALILGAFFGAYFNVSKYKIAVVYLEGNQEQVELVENWQKIDFVRPSTGEVVASFGKEDQLKLLNYYNGLKKSEREGLVVSATEFPEVHGEYTFTFGKRIEGVMGIQRVETIAVRIKPVGEIFMRLLMFLAIPLVISSLILSAARLGDIRKAARLGGKTLFLFLMTTVIAVAIGLLLVNALKPGAHVSPDSRERLIGEFSTSVQEGSSNDLIDVVLNKILANPITALAHGGMFQIVFFALLIGVLLTLIAKEKSPTTIDFFDSLNDALIKMVNMIMVVAPLGVFALISATTAEFGFDIVQTLTWYLAVVLIGLLIHTVFVYGGLVHFFGGMNPGRFFAGMRETMLIAFSTGSGAAALPVNMECCERNLGVPRSATSFVLPLGAAINMAGLSLYQAVAVVFIAQVYGIDLHLSDQLTILLIAILSSVVSKPIPGMGIGMLVIVLRSVNVPEEGAALILGIDRFLDMCCTTVSSTGSAAVAAVVAKSEGILEEV